MALEAMGLDVDSADYIWVYHIANKLDTETRRQWELNKAGNDFQTMESLKKFLEERAWALDFSSSKDSCKVFRHDKCDKKQTQQIYYSQSEAPQVCPKCGTQHSIYSCDAFRALNLDGKLEFVKNKRLCFNCLKPDHSIKDCKSKSTCRTCKKRHHTLLHRQPVQAQSEVTTQSCLGHKGATSLQTVLLPTAMVQVKTGSNTMKPIRALLDSGSQITCITSKCSDRLGLKTRQADIQISGIGGKFSAKSGSVVNLQLIPPFQDAITTTAVVLDRVAKQLPSYPVQEVDFGAFKGLQWADPNFATPGEIDMILGCDVYEQVVGTEKRTLNKQLFARNTAFGWIISGVVPKKMISQFRHFMWA